MHAWERLTKKGKIPVGLIYVEKKPSYEALALPDKKKPLAFNDLDVDESRLERIMNTFQ